MVGKHNRIISKDRVDLNLINHNNIIQNTLPSIPNDLDIKISNNTVENSVGTHCRKAISDSGCSGNYFCLRDETYLTDVKNDPNGIEIELPNGNRLTSTKRGKLKLEKLPESAKTVYIFPEMNNFSLLSIGVMCDAGLKATLDREKIIIYDERNIVLTGKRDPTTKMWMIDLNQFNNSAHTSADKTLNISANAISNQTKSKLAKFHHGSMGYPAMSSFKRAIKSKYLATFPGLT